ncbi:MAG: hypothetical protein EBZ77_11135, partial [Chitinophagia bacterium]|nr:hypothetical protein [Chitinophagia bacterium]
ICLACLSLAVHAGSPAYTYVRLWVQADSSHNMALFEMLYAPTVEFYGFATPKKTCIARKQQFFAKHPDYTVTLAGNVAQQTLADKSCKVTFDKAVTLGGKTTLYRAYLVLRPTGDTWTVITEGDTTTDYNLRRKKEKADSAAAFCIGDYNGDGKKETVTLIAPETTDDMDCKGPCTCVLRFSDRSIPDIKLESCIGGIPVNHGDLNLNGTDELGILPSWFTSCWRAYQVFTLINNKWTFAVEPFSTHCQQWEDGVVPILKDPKVPGNALIHYMVMGDEDFKLKTKSVKVKK